MYTDDWTEKQLQQLERSLAGIYREASADLRAKVDQYWNGWDETIKENGETKVIHHAGLKERYEKEYQAYKEGKYTKEEFEAWCRAQVARGQRWEAMRDQMAERLTNTNVIAADYINNDIPRIFAENANYEAFKIEQITGRTSFTLVNEDAVKRLSQGGVLILPHMGIGITKDQAWNAQKLQNSLLQGILQGEAIGKIADRFQAVSNMNRSAAIRNARTAVTGAQNAGRQNTMGRARDMGIELQKEWKATEDARTRESHARLDGVRVELDDTFPNGCRWPGDPLGAPEEVYNCRCVMKTIYPRYNGEARLAKYYDPVSGEYKERYNTVDSYNRWKEEKMKSSKWYDPDNEKLVDSESELGVFRNNHLKSDTRITEDYYSTLKEKFSHGSDDAKRIFNKYVPSNVIVDSAYEGTPEAVGGRIYMHYGLDQNNKRGPGATWFHEHGHVVDYYANYISEKKEFLDVLRKDFLDFTSRKTYTEIAKELNSMREHSAVSDMIHGLSEEKIVGVAFHGRRLDGTSYWTDQTIANEAFAHMFECQFDDIRHSVMKKWFPNSLSFFEESMMKELLNEKKKTD